MTKVKTLLILVGILLTGICQAKTTTHVYSLKISQYVPRIYDNTESKGYRQYELQQLAGYLYFSFYKGVSRPEIFITGLYNKTHKIGGNNITYETTVDNAGYQVYPRVNLIGSNKTGKFNTVSCCFYVDADPSYNKGGDTEDNTLLCVFAGKGTTKTRTVKAWQEYTYKDARGKKRTGTKLVTLGKYRIINTIRGNNAGSIGCGCTEYGHISPTRVAGALAATSEVDDVAATYGTWSASYVGTLVTD